MGFFDFFGVSHSPKEVGREVLSAYYDEAILFPEFNYPSYDAWSAFLDSRVPEFEAHIGDLVLMNSASTDVEMARDRMKDLASKSGGTANASSLTMAAGGSGDTVNWSQLIPDVAEETVSDAGQVLTQTGQGVISNLNAIKFLPWAIGGGLLLYFVFLGKSSGSRIGKAAQGFSKEAGRAVRKLSDAGSDRIRGKK